MSSSVRIRFAIVLLAILTLVPRAAPAQQSPDENAAAWRDRFVAATFTRDDQELKYRLLSPEKPDPDKRYPLVLFLHGAGERGDDNQGQLVHGMRDFAKRSESFPAYVVAPQCPSRASWCDVQWTGERHTMAAEPNATMKLTLALVDQLTKDLPVDPDRIYVTGLSMGGFGTYDAVARRPELFAAAAPICGGSDESEQVMKHLAQVPFWIAHGAADNIVSVEWSRRAIEALKQAGSDPHYVELPDVGHDSWSATYGDDKFFEWMFAQKKVHEAIGK
jgi:predicted peptidase